MLASIGFIIVSFGMFGVFVSLLLLVLSPAAERPELAWHGAAFFCLGSIGVFTFGAWLAGFPMQ